jgi:transposase-like protein
MTSDERERLKQLERENKELKRANEIVRMASAFFAQAELDKNFKLNRSTALVEWRQLAA